MTDKIEPVIPATEWATMARYQLSPAKVLWEEVSDIEHNEAVRREGADFAKVIAFANAALPDSDTRKLTWEMVDALRTTANGTQASSDNDDSGEWVVPHYDDLLLNIADIIASYLPPREPEPKVRGRYVMPSG